MKIDKITPQIAALYLGQKCDVSKHPIYWDNKDLATVPDTITSTTISYLAVYSAFEIAPHLRRLESITEEEARELYQACKGSAWEEKPGIMENKDLWEPQMALKDWWNDVDEWYAAESDFRIGSPSVWLYLLSKGFDLFGLIGSGLAKEI